MGWFKKKKKKETNQNLCNIMSRLYGDKVYLKLDIWSIYKCWLKMNCFKDVHEHELCFFCDYFQQQKVKHVMRKSKTWEQDDIQVPWRREEQSGILDFSLKVNWDWLKETCPNFPLQYYLNGDLLCTP